MCVAPCCGTVEDMQRLIDSGYAHRLMHDPYEGGAEMLKPALKGHEGKLAPWNVWSEQGCTFWRDGLCELHDLGLKPLQGKLAHHDLMLTQSLEIGEKIDKDWADFEGIDEMVKNWRGTVKISKKFFAKLDPGK